MHIHVFCVDVPRREQEKIAACVSGNAEISLVDVDHSLLEKIRRMPVARHLTITAYLSICIPKLLEGSGERLVYIDSDIVVNTSLEPLFEIDLEGRSVGAVRDSTSPERQRVYNEAIGHAAGEPYFNSGLLVVDIESWNRRTVTERGMAFAGAQNGPLLQHDQDVLNKVLKDDWIPLDPSWNEKPTRLTPDAARTMPILHYRGRRKPFHADFPMAYRTLYDAYRAQTPWATARRIGKMERSLLKRGRALSRHRRSAERPVSVGGGSARHRFRHAAAILLAIGFGWMSHDALGPFFGRANAADFVDEAVISHRTTLVRAAMRSQPKVSGYDAEEIGKATGITMPRLPAAWRVLDVQVYPSDAGLSVQISAEAETGEHFSIFGMRVDTPGGSHPSLDRRQEDGIAYWEEGELAFAVVGSMEAKRLLQIAGQLNPDEPAAGADGVGLNAGSSKGGADNGDGLDRH